MIRRALVAMDGSAHGVAAAALAIEWARRFDAELIGLGILDKPSITSPEPVSFGGTAFKRHRDEARLADEHRRVLELLGEFHRRCAAERVRCSVVEDIGAPHEQIVAEASEMLGQARHDVEALERLSEGLAAGAPLEAVLEDVRRAFRLAALVLRHADDRVVATAPAGYAARATPAAALDPRTLLGDERRHRLGRRGFRLPEGGGRLRLAGHPEPLWLDLWEGDEEGLSGDEHRALAVAAMMLRLALRPDPTLSARVS